MAAGTVLTSGLHYSHEFYLDEATGEVQTLVNLIDETMIVTTSVGLAQNSTLLTQGGVTVSDMPSTTEATTAETNVIPDEVLKQLSRTDLDINDWKVKWLTKFSNLLIFISMIMWCIFTGLKMIFLSKLNIGYSIQLLQRLIFLKGFFINKRKLWC